MSLSAKCKNCIATFFINEDDLIFYSKIEVPVPTLCPKCRLIRRFVWRNEHFLFKKKDDYKNQLVFSAYPTNSKIKILEHDYWWGDGWDSTATGFDYDFSRTFFSQFYDLMISVPWCSRSIKNSVNSEYCNNVSDLKDAYLCFSGINGQNLAYGFCFSGSNDCIDFYQTKDSRFCYETFSIVDCERMFWSSDCANCYNLWFSNNCRNCSDCFGCVNLRNKNHCIFNEQYTKEEYEQKIKELYDGSSDKILKLINKMDNFEIGFPDEHIHGRRNKNVTGDYLYACNNVLDSFEIHNVDNARFSQFVRHSQDVYDFTSWGINSSLIYESVNCGDNTQNLKFCFECWPNCYNLEYCIDCHSSSNCFGCVGLKKKEYCIFNTQYSKEDYIKLRSRIIEHMISMPYEAENNQSYVYGEFFPPEFSPFKYNESSAHDYFPKIQDTKLTEASGQKYIIEINSELIPRTIAEVDDLFIQKVIGCKDKMKCEHKCPGAFKITRIELDFYRRFNIPIPSLCPNCRFYKRMEKLNPIEIWDRSCMCEKGTHQHKNKCSVKFKTNYPLSNPKVLFCDECYKQEVC